MEEARLSVQGPMALGGWTSVHGETATGIRYVRWLIDACLLSDIVMVE